MAKIQLIVEGGKASPTPQVAQTLGPMKINISEVMTKINEATKDFKGIKVPVNLLVNEKTKDYTIAVGSPPTSELIKKELGLETGSGAPNKNKVGNIAVEQLIKIAKMKMTSTLEKKLVNAVKTVAGSCNSLGILCEGKESADFNRDLGNGKYDKELQAEKTDVSPDKLKQLKEQLVVIQEELNKKFAAAAAEAAAAAPAETVAPAAATGAGAALTAEAGKDAKGAAPAKATAPAEATKAQAKETLKKK